MTTAGTYNRTVPSTNGCDSVITLALTVRPNSTAAISASICEGQSYAFGTQSLTSAGTYNRTVPSANGCDSVITLNLGILPTPNAGVSASGPLSICQGDQVTLQVLSGVGLQYAWRLNGQNIAGATNAAYTASQSGIYTILVTNSEGCSALSLPNVVIVSNNPGATINAAGPTTFCQGGSVVLNANTGAGLNYQWFRNGIIIAGATGSNYTASLSGSYSVRVGIGQGCQSLSNSIQVIENMTPSVVIVSSGPTNICTGGTGVVLLVSNQGLGQSYQWRQGGVAVPGATGSTYTVNQTGTYDCIVSFNGCGSVSNGISVTVNANPTVSVSPGGPTTFCQGGSVSLSASPVTGGTYQWTSGGVNIPGATQLSYLATTTGNFAVRVTNANGCVGNSVNTLVTVKPLPVAQINASGSTNFCLGGSVLLRADSASGLTYQWQLNGQNIAGATLSTFSATQQGAYRVIVTGNGCSVTSGSIATSINNLPTASITPSGSTTICQGSPLSLQANSGSGLTYQWRLAGNTIPGANFISYTPLQSGVYTVVVTNASGCNAVSSPVTVTINTLPLANIIPLGSTTICSGSSVVLQANSGPGLTYQWYSGNTPISGATSQNLPSSATGLYKVQVTNSSGCVALSNDIFVNVVSLPSASIFASGSTNICQGSSVLLQTTAIPGATYQWRNGNLNISGATASSFQATVAGNYSLQVTNSNNCSSITNAIAVSILPTRSTNLTDTACQGSLYSFGGRILNASGVYRDTLATSNGCDSVVTLNFVQISSPGVPILSLNATRDTLSASTLVGIVRWFRNGVLIQGVASRFLPVTSPGVYTAQSEISLGSKICRSDLSSPFWITLTGVDEVAKHRANLIIYPNPANQFVTIRSITPESQAHKLEIYDLAGKLVMELNNLDQMDSAQASVLEIDITALSQGTYYLQIYGKSLSLIDRQKLSVIR